MFIEIHTHTTEHSPCGKISAVQLVSFLMRQGIEGVVLTDHHYLWTDKELALLKEQNGIPESFLLLSGQEVTTSDFGDVLVYGADESIQPGISLNALRKRVPGAAIIWAHPYRGMCRPTALELMDASFDAIEILNPHQSEEGNATGLRDWQDWGFIATSGSDIHSDLLPSLYPSKFDNPIHNIAELVSALKNGALTPVESYPCLS
ncbi:MAG: PolIIIAc domain protein [Deltaproteobacteria bacterium]|nr:PolIIIAc domain protein [Deltaproteobacteria bacterium]